VLDSGRWGGHSDFVKRLEREFAGFTHCAHAISAMNGTVTLEMALAAAAWARATK
jgi:dTDP-4-amino-4,6-dideoxygalactose transaminase